MSQRTLDRILDAALHLFNDESVPKVSINRIASEVGISAGNLYYHFKTKDLIVDRLMHRFESSMASITSPDNKLRAIDDLWLLLHLSFELIQKYLFVFRDVDFLVREYPDLRRRFEVIVVQAMKATQQTCTDLRRAGALDATDDDIDSIAFNVVFVSTCWSTFAPMLPTHATDTYGVAAYRVLSMFTPYLRGDSRVYMNYMRSKYIR